MDRRSLLKYSALVGIARPFVSTAIAEAQTSKEQVQKAIVLYCDLAIDPAREQEMLHQFHSQFKPAAEKFEGYIDNKSSSIVGRNSLYDSTTLCSISRLYLSK